MDISLQKLGRSRVGTDLPIVRTLCLLLVLTGASVAQEPPVPAPALPARRGRAGIDANPSNAELAEQLRSSSPKSPRLAPSRPSPTASRPRSIAEPPSRERSRRGAGGTHCPILDRRVRRRPAVRSELHEGTASERKEPPTVCPDRYHSGAFAGRDEPRTQYRAVRPIKARYKYNHNATGPLGGGGYFSFSSPDDEFSLNVTNQITVDGTFVDRARLPTNEQGFNIPFARSFIYGNITEDWSYQVGVQGFSAPLTSSTCSWPGISMII